MRYTRNFDPEFVDGLEEEPIIATAEPEACKGWAQLLDVAASCLQVTIQAVEYFQRPPTVDAPKIGSGFIEPSY